MYGLCRVLKCALCMAVCSCAGLAAGAQIKVCGTIRGNGRPLAGVTVMLNGVTVRAVTDSMGAFCLHAPGVGSYVLTAQAAGYSVYQQRVALTDTSARLPVILLLRFANELEAVKVVNSYAAMRKRESTLQVDVVNRDYILRHLGGSLMKSLEKLPGIKSIGIGSGNSKPLIRGLGFNQVVVVENGMKHEGQQWGADHGLEIDQYAAAGVEIVKGPAAIIYGSDAIAGAVDIQPAALPEPNSAGGALDVTGKSNNGQWAISGNAFTRTQRWFVAARITATEYGDYRVPADTVYVYSYAAPLHNNQVRNTAGRELNLQVSTGWLGTKVQSVFHASRNYNRSGFFANAHGLEPRRIDAAQHDGSSRDIQLPSQQVTHYKLINHTTFQLGIHRLKTTVGMQRNFRQEWNRYVNHGYMPAVYPAHMHIPSTLERQYDKTAASLQIRDEWQWRQHRITIGGNGDYQHNSISGWSFLIPAFTQWNAGAYLYDKLELNNEWMVNAALRYDYGEIDMKEYADWFTSPVSENGDTSRYFLRRSQNALRRFNSINWSAGLGYTPGNWRFTINAGSSFRMPIAKELGANGVNYHYFRYEKGNGQLNAERSYQLDVSAGWNSEKAVVSVSPFLNYFPNYIFLNPTAAHDFFYGAGNQVFEYTQSRVLRYGAELQLRYHFLPQWSGSLAGEYLYNRQLSGSKNGYTLPFTPPPSVLAGLTWKPAFRKALSDAYLSLECRVTAAQQRIVPPERETPGYRLLDFSAGTRLLTRRQPIHVHLQVQNLLNTRYLNHTSFYRLIALPEAGRNIVLSVRIPFLYGAGTPENH